MFWTSLGWLAVVLTATQFVPQVVSAYKTRKLEDLSLMTFALIVITASLWIAHGIHNTDNVIIAANSLVLISAVLIVILKIKSIK